MIVVVPILLLFLIPLVLFLLHVFKPGFFYHWPIAMLGSLLVWSGLLLTHSLWSGSIAILEWQPRSIFGAGIEFTFDRYAWAFSFALITLLLSSFLTGAVPTSDTIEPRPSWSILSGSLLITGFGILASAAGNLLTFQLIWMLVEVSDLINWVTNHLDEREIENLSFAFMVRVASLAILFWATITTIAKGYSLNFSDLAPEIAPFLILAGGLRLGVLPPYPYPAQNIKYSLKQGAVLHLSSCAPALILITRASQSAASATGASMISILAGLAVLSAGFGWLGASQTRAGPLHWIGAAGALVVLSGNTARPEAALSWSLAFLLAGGLLFQYIIRPVWLRPLLWIGAISLSSVPLAPTWAGIQIYDPPNLLGIILIAGQSLLVISYIRYSFEEGPQTVAAERWIWAVYLLGLSLSLATLLGLGTLTFPSASDPIVSLQNLDLLIPGLFILALAGAIQFLLWLRPLSTKKIFTKLEGIFNFGWLYRLLFPLLLPLRRFLELGNILLEGQAGMIWAFLVLVLFITLFRQIGLGG